MSTGENAVIEFLTRNPDFLIRHPDLLRRLTVPHGFDGKAVSLLEYQARLLRERLDALEQQYQSECLKSDAHRRLSKNLKTFLARLYASRSTAQLLDALKIFLNQHFSASSIRIFAAAHAANGSATTSGILYPLDAWRRGLFTLILNNPKPLCDSLQYEHLAALFGEEADRIHSSVLIPLRFRNAEALLALGSREWHKYRQSLELDILTVVTEILSQLSETVTIADR